MTAGPTRKAARKTATAAPRKRAGRPRQGDVAQIEARLLAAALDEFTTHGYGAASLNRIVRAAGVSKTTLYSRFTSKEDLFRAIMRDEIQRLDAATVLSPGGRRPPLAHGLRAYASHMLELNLRGDLLAVNRLIASEAHRFPELAAAASERAELGIARISAYIADCAQDDGLPCRDPSAVAAAFIFMLRGWHAYAMLAGHKLAAKDRERWVERAVHTLIAARHEW